MRSVVLSVLAVAVLSACTDPVADQAAVDTRSVARRADNMLALDFAPGSARPDPAQESQLRALVGDDRHGQRDEFVVLSDGTGGAIQQHRANQVAQSLTRAGARWVSTSVDAAIASGADKLVVVRSEYRIGNYNCPSFTPSTIANPNETNMPNYGCASAYNMGQMLARPRDAAVGRSPGPVDGTVSTDAVQRYREGRVRATGGVSTGGAAAAGSPPPQ